MKTREQPRLELVHARTELAFLLSEQVRAQADETSNVRRHINQLLEAINGEQYRGSGGAPLF
jgi:hypothetical protein